MNRFFKSIAFTSIVTLSAFFAVVYSGCKKTETTSVDKCATMTCQNEGVCFKGICTCKEGFEGMYCETKWLSRYTGTWDIKETVTGSTDNSIKNQQISYRTTIQGKEGNAANFIINNFRNNPNYKAECRIGINEKGGKDASTKFIFQPNQVVGEKQIVDGYGSVNASGKYIQGVYFLLYPTDNGPGRDTVNITAEYVP